MLEDQHEEQACLYVLGLLTEKEAREFEDLAATDGRITRAAAEFEEALTNLSLAITPFREPAAGLKSRILDRIDHEPARVTTDREGRIESINPAFTRMCGYSFSELRGRKPGHVLQGTGTHADVVDRLREAINDRKPCEVEILNYHKNGTPYLVDIRLEPLRDENDEFAGFRAEERKIETLA